jgi:hypothetical protein
MVPYAPAAYCPPAPSPRIGQYGPPGHFLGSGYRLSQTFDQMFGWSPAMGDTVRLLFHGATAALGYHVWLKDKGFFKYFGLFLALGQTVGAICDALSLVQRAAGTHPPEEIPKGPAA